MPQRKPFIPLLLVLATAAAFSSAAEEGPTIGFVGDIMFHSSQLRRAWLGKDDSGADRGYDFSPSFEWITPYLEAPDLMIGNLETTLGGPGSALITEERYAFREYQAYPTFTAPDELAPALASAGFDLLGTANNHCLDSGLEGASRTLDRLEEAGLAATGTAAEGSPMPWRGEIGGYNLSVLAWTASTNGIIFPRGMESVNVFNHGGHDERLAEMLKEIREEAARGPDLLILFIHWGLEYLEEPDRYQRNLADLAFEAGADVVIGSHPHVLQPVERRILDGPDGPREAFIAWSMGNFISSQRHSEGPWEWVDGSVMITLGLGRDARGRARVSGLSFVPLYVHWTDGSIRVMAVGDGLAEEGRERFGLSDYDMERLTALDTWVPGQMTRYLGALPARRSGVAWQVVFPEP